MSQVRVLLTTTRSNKGSVFNIAIIENSNEERERETKIVLGRKLKSITLTEFGKGGVKNMFKGADRESLKLTAQN